jgi:hypothetical protein
MGCGRGKGWRRWEVWMLVARSLYEDGRCISQMLLGVSVDRSCSTNQLYIQICAIIPSWAFSIKHVVFVRCFLNIVHQTRSRSNPPTVQLAASKLRTAISSSILVSQKIFITCNESDDWSVSVIDLIAEIVALAITPTLTLMPRIMHSVVFPQGFGKGV